MLNSKKVPFQLIDHLANMLLPGQQIQRKKTINYEKKKKNKADLVSKRFVFHFLHLTISRNFS